MIDSIEILVKHGAKWKPEAESVSSARRHFRHLEPARILRVLTILKEHQAAEVAFLESLVATPTMRTHLGDTSKKITHLFHAPPPKPAEPAASKPEPPPGAANTGREFYSRSHQKHSGIRLLKNRTLGKPR